MNRRNTSWQKNLAIGNNNPNGYKWVIVMKKLKLLVVLVICLLLMVACGNDSVQNTSSEQTTPDISTESQKESTVSQTVEQQETETENSSAESAEKVAETKNVTEAETETTIIRPDMNVDQEGVLQAELDYYYEIWPVMVNGISLYSEGKGPNDFKFHKPSVPGDYILDRVGKRMIPVSHEYALILEGLKDPQLLEQLDIGSGKYYILDTDCVFYIEIYTDSSRKEYPLPDGLTEADVRDMIRWWDYNDEDEPLYLLLITDEAGNFYLDEQGQWQPTEMGYHVARQGDIWTVSCPGICWEIPLKAEEIQVHDITSNRLAISYKDTENACIHRLDFEDGLLKESIIDTSDWVMIPRSFCDGGRIMAPKEDGIYFYLLRSGIERLDALPSVPDLSSLREGILAGEVVSLNDGAAVQLMDGFILDMDGDGKKEQLHVTRGLDKAGKEIFEFYVNEYRMGFSAYRNQYGSLEPAIYSVEWPDTGEFSKEAGYSLYLASLDGERISLFLSNEEQTYGLDFEEFHWDETYCYQGIVRIRGIGKGMEDFIPCQALESYIQDGWLVRPREGDRLDVTGDGKTDYIGVGHLNYIPFGEGIQVNEGEFREFYWEEENSNCGFGFPLLYYTPGNQGGYDLIGEVIRNGQTITQRFPLTE